ncbi:MAG: sigma-54 dependent transcriptional regulator [Deltaproteobacteria bacterium]|nr:sigma-54 dependent transcriptional regulator [Deltaproteobacteria bacterium]
MTTPAILAVEDDAAAAELLRLALEGEGFEVRLAANGIEAILAMETALPDLVISDLRMPEMDGLTLLSRVKQRWPAVPFILASVEDDIATVVEAVQMGAVNYLVKPFSPALLTLAVRKALHKSPPRQAGDGALGEIVGRSRQIVEVRHAVAVAARSDVNVLITGETGTGKELVARAIHRCSKLSLGPFVAENCAAIPPELFESQFFGHRRGAFTGADRDHAGLLQRADGGVLFLDELESLGAIHQAKLLRVLDDGEIRPVGSSEARQISVRFLAATNRDSQSMIRAGQLREDLYYRLRGFEIHLPPLNARRDDIPLLAAHFLRGEASALTPEALKVLRARSWPGNVRELQNAIRSAESLAAGAPIGVEHLSFGAAFPNPEATAVAEPCRLLRAAERGAIVEALRVSNGKRSEAARRLGIDRSTLRRKLREFAIDPAPPSADPSPPAGPPPKPPRDQLFN